MLLGFLWIFGGFTFWRFFKGVSLCFFGGITFLSFLWGFRFDFGGGITFLTFFKDYIFSESTFSVFPTLQNLIE